MPSSSAEMEPAVIASQLLGDAVSSVESVYGGRNSRVFRIEAEKRRYALKLYASHADNRDRLDAEIAAYRFFALEGVGTVPALVAADRTLGAALYEWVEGVSVCPPGMTAGVTEIDAAVDFLRSLHGLRGSVAAATLSDAAEACLAPSELLAQIERRRNRLLTDADRCIEPMVGGEAGRILAMAAVRARCLCADANVAFDAPLPTAHRTLSPSDFGFHNARRRPDGQLVFLDFEYFGWDDPVKLTADFLLHPGMALGERERERFRIGVGAFYGEDPLYHIRLDALLPLYALRWCMIVLNEFLPERWRQRLHAGIRQSRESVLADQRGKARTFLALAESLAGNAN